VVSLSAAALRKHGKIKGTGTHTPNNQFKRPCDRGQIDRFAGVSEGNAERESAGEIPSVAEGSAFFAARNGPQPPSAASCVEAFNICGSEPTPDFVAQALLPVTSLPNPESWTAEACPESVEGRYQTSLHTKYKRKYPSLSRAK
jgi:hypothetical protein